MNRSRLWLMSVLIVLVLLLSGSSANAASQPSPVPSPGPSAKSQTKQPEGCNRNTDRNETPTPKQVAPVNIGPTLNLQKKATYRGEYGDQKEQGYHSIDIWLIVFNGLLAAFTLALVIVGAIQAKRLRETVELTKETADAAKTSADVAQRALTVLEAPYVSIGEIVPHVFRIEDGNRVHSPNIPMTFEFGLKNHGRSVAEIVTVHSELCIFSMLPVTPEYSVTVEPSGNFAIGPNSDTGKMRWFVAYKCPADKVVEEFESLLGGFPNRRLVCFGYINYMDSFMNSWKSGFAWAWYPYSDSVFFVGGSAYNYNRKIEQNSALS